MNIPFFIPNITETEIDAVTATLRSNWLTSGPRVAEFETEFAKAVKAPHALAVNSCTAGLHLALVASGIGVGDEVIVPTMTFAATASVVIHAGARPVLVDVDPETLLMDPDAVERAITSRTRAVVPVHYGGQPCDMTRLIAIARSHNLLIIEDAAHAFPAEVEGGMVGSLGDVTCFSFYANKTLTTGEGGMVTTADTALAEKIGRMRLHGLNRQAWDRFKIPKAWDYDIAEPGYKYNLTDIAAAIGLGQLSRADELWKKRQSLAELYGELLTNVPGVKPLTVLSDRRHAWHLYVVRIEATVTGISRNEVVDKLQAAGIGTSVHYRPLHLHSYYATQLGYSAEDFPAGTAAFDEILSLPIYPRLEPTAAAEVVERLVEICAP